MSDILDKLRNVPEGERRSALTNDEVTDKVTEAVKEIEEAIDEKVAEAVNVALIEAKDWITVGEGDSIFDQDEGATFNPYEDTSIFGMYPDTISGGDRNHKFEKDKVKLAESEWANVGLSAYQDPENMQTVEKLRLHQSASLFQYINYPIARSEVENLKRYVLGRGIRIDCLAEPVMKVLKNFWMVNDMESRNKGAFQMYLIDGEYFILFFDNHAADDFDEDVDAVLLVRSVPSAEVDEVEFDDEDRETRLSYKRDIPKGDLSADTKYYLDIDYPFGDERELRLPKRGNVGTSEHAAESQNARMMMFKHGLLYDARGRVGLESILKWNRVAVDFLYSRARLNHLRSKIFLIKTQAGKVGKTLTSATSVQKMPKGGMMLVETPDRQFRMVSPNTGADDAEKDYKMILYMIGSALSMPIHILNMNAENENYASIKEAANPFNQAVQDYQDEWGEHLKKLFRYVISHAVRLGVLDTEYQIEYLPEDVVGEVKRMVNTRLKEGVDAKAIVDDLRDIVEVEKETKVIPTTGIPISIIFPTIIKTDPTQEAQAIKIYMELGLMSKYTARLKVGVDPDVEEARLNIEWEEGMAKREQAMQRFNNGRPDDEDAKPKDDDDKSDDEKKSEEQMTWCTEDGEFLFSEEFDLSEDEEFDESSADDPTNADRQARYREKNKAKVKLRAKLHSKLRSGDMKKPAKCTGCGKVTTKLHAHHTNYKKATEVRWLCRRCEVHADNRKQGRKKGDK